MDIFLIKATITRKNYGSYEVHKFDDIRLVKAENSQEAFDKFEKFWKDKTSEYSVYYNVANWEVLETIV